jgi:NarL family two-component system response regulator LiaR
VLRLIAIGLGYAEIAGKLVISENTVKAHARSILSRLLLADRTQAVLYAWREGIVRRD